MFLSCMVTIAEHANVEVFTQGLEHIMWDSFLYITVELSQIIGGEGRHVNIGVRWVKDKLRVMFLLEGSHDVEGSIQVAFTGVSKMRGKERYFSRNVDAAELNYPMGHTNKVLIE